MPWLLSWIVCFAGGADPGAGVVLATEPPMVPSGMDLLYSDQVAFKPSGEPIVTIGLMSGQRTIVLRSSQELQLDFYQSGVLKRATIRPDQELTATLIRADPAERRHYADIDGLDWAKRGDLDAALERWRGRGYGDVEAIEEGTVLGIGGRILDNRAYRVVVPAKSAQDARRIAKEIYERFGEHAVPRSRLIERPWGELRIATAAGPLGIATSYARIVPADGERGRITVDAVEHAKGYAWHGREDRTYAGEMYVVIGPDGLLAAVNVVGAETVLRGVVPSELFASAPREALAAQAVAARNHLLAQLGRRHHGDPFHLCAEQHCQVYTGVQREDPRTDAAIAATFGQALFYDGKLVHAVYSSTCGGHTEDNDAVWGESPDPALRGRPDFDAGAAEHSGLTRFAGDIDSDNIRAWVEGYPDTYCSRTHFARPQKFRWQRRIPAAELRRLIAARFADVGRPLTLRVKERGRGGTVISLEIVGDTGSATVVLELPIRRLFDNLNSGTFVIEPERDAGGGLTAVTFTGAGWGHGVGMCQLGAIGRAEAGQTYREILGHYYNGANVAQIYGKDEPATPSPPLQAALP